MTVNRVVLKLPIAGWGARTQTLSLLGSTDGAAFTTLVASRSATFRPASSNTATITFTATSQRFLRLNVTANTGWPAGQVSEFESTAPDGRRAARARRCAGRAVPRGARQRVDLVGAVAQVTEISQLCWPSTGAGRGVGRDVSL